MAIPTYITVTGAPPATVTMGESFPFSGVLFDMDGNPLENKLIELYADGAKVAEGYSDDRGWEFFVTLYTRGTHTVHVEFPGDETYEPSSSDVYTFVVIGQETYITVVDAPPSDSGAGEPFYISGWFEILNVRTLYKTVELYVDGVKVKSERTGCSFIPTAPEHDPGRWRFAVPTPQILGTHTVEVRFPGDDTHEPSSSGVMEFNAVESLVVPTIENVYVPTTVAPWEYWLGYFHLCNRGTGVGYVRAVLQGDIDGATPNILLNPGGCQTIAIGGTGPASFTIRVGV